MSYSRALAEQVLQGALSQVGAGFWPGRATGRQRFPEVPHSAKYKYVSRAKKATPAQIAKAHARQAAQQDMLLNCWASAQGRAPRPAHTLSRGPRAYPSASAYRAPRARKVAPAEHYPGMLGYLDPALRRRVLGDDLPRSGRRLGPLGMLQTPQLAAGAAAFRAFHRAHPHLSKKEASVAYQAAKRG